MSLRGYCLIILFNWVAAYNYILVVMILYSPAKVRSHGACAYQSAALWYTLRTKAPHFLGRFGTHCEPRALSFRLFATHCV